MPIFIANMASVKYVMSLTPNQKRAVAVSNKPSLTEWVTQQLHKACQTQNIT